MIKEESPSVVATKSKSQNSKKLKRKLTSGRDLDQYDCKFGIRLDSDDDVLLMSDESEVSSLDEEDVADLRHRYNEVDFSLELFLCPLMLKLFCKFNHSPASFNYFDFQKLLIIFCLF